MLVILQHEIHRLRSALHAWIILAVAQFILAWSFLSRLEIWLNRQYDANIKSSQFGVTDFVLIPQFQLALTFISIVLGFLTAQSFAGEKQQKTWPLLISSPIAIYKIIIAKFTALLIFCCLILAMILLMSFCLSWQTHLDYGQLFSSALLFLFTCAALIMLGLFISSYFSNPVAASIVTLICFVLLFNTHWLLIDGDNVFLKWLSFREHQFSARKGLIDSYDILFFISITAIFYIVTFVKIDNQRL